MILCSAVKDNSNFIRLHGVRYRVVGVCTTMAAPSCLIHYLAPSPHIPWLGSLESNYRTVFFLQVFVFT